MKVYAVVSYSDFYGVFSTREKAEACVQSEIDATGPEHKRIIEKHGLYQSIIECEMDIPIG